MNHPNEQDKRNVRSTIISLLEGDQKLGECQASETVDEAHYYTLIILRSAQYTNTTQGGSALILHEEPTPTLWQLRTMINVEPTQAGFLPRQGTEDNDAKSSLDRICLYSIKEKREYKIEEPNWFTLGLSSFTTPSFMTLYNSSTKADDGQLIKTFHVGGPPKNNRLYEACLYGKDGNRVRILNVGTSVDSLSSKSFTSNYTRALNVLRGDHLSRDRHLRVINLFLTTLENRGKDESPSADYIERIYGKGANIDSKDFIGKESERLGVGVFSGWFLLFALSESDMFGGGVVGSFMTHEKPTRLASTCRELIRKLKEPFLTDLYKEWTHCHPPLDWDQIMDTNSMEEKFLSQLKAFSVSSNKETREYILHELITQSDYRKKVASPIPCTRRIYSPILHILQNGAEILTDSKSVSPRVSDSFWNPYVFINGGYGSGSPTQGDPSQRKPLTQPTPEETLRRQIESILSHEVVWRGEHDTVFTLFGFIMKLNPQHLDMNLVQAYITMKLQPKLDYIKAIHIFLKYKKALKERRIPDLPFSTYYLSGCAKSLTHIKNLLQRLKENVVKLAHLAARFNENSVYSPTSHTIEPDREDFLSCLLTISCVVYDLNRDLDTRIAKSLKSADELPSLPLFERLKPTFQDEIRERVFRKDVDPLCIRLLINEMCLQATKYNDRELASLVEKFSSLLYVYMKNEE